MKRTAVRFRVGMGHRIGWRNPPEAPVYRGEWNVDTVAIAGQ